MTVLCSSVGNLLFHSTGIYAPAHVLLPPGGYDQQ